MDGAMSEYVHEKGPKEDKLSSSHPPTHIYNMKTSENNLQCTYMGAKLLTEVSMRLSIYNEIQDKLKVRYYTTLFGRSNLLYMHIAQGGCFIFIVI